MLFTSKSSGQSLPLRAILSLGIPMILALGFVNSPFAQSTPGGYGPGGPGTIRGGGGLGGGDRRGPASPAIMRDSIGLSGDKLQQYTRRYESHMANTKPARDSLRASVQAVRAAFESGDRSAARAQRDIIERQSKEISTQDKAFDKGLKDLLTKDQQKRYDKWKANREKEEGKRWRGERRRPLGHEGWLNQVPVH